MTSLSRLTCMGGLFLLVAPWKASSGRMAERAAPMSMRWTLPVLETTPSTRSPFTGTYYRGQRSSDMGAGKRSGSTHPLSAEVNPNLLPQFSSEHARNTHPHFLSLPLAFQPRSHPPPSPLHHLTRQHNPWAQHIRYNRISTSARTGARGNINYKCVGAGGADQASCRPYSSSSCSPSRSPPWPARMTAATIRRLCGSSCFQKT